MLTYVINTSENKTLDCDKLFELSGYNRIRWMNCKLNRVEACAEEIFQSNQNVFVGNFRLVVLVDFFNYDKVRTSYSVDGSKEIEGVDLAVYLPFIEAYLTDHLFEYLGKKNIHVSDCSIIYIHGDKCDEYVQIYDREYQLSRIIKGEKSTIAPVPEEVMANRRKADNELRIQNGESPVDDPDAPLMSVKEQLERKVDVQALAYAPDPYRSYNLHCTPEMQLTFSIDDYPYGYSDPVDYDTFYRMFMTRVDTPNRIHKYHFVAQHTSSIAGMAFDSLVLSLSLVRTFEREDEMGDATDIVVDDLSPDALREVLERSWRKIRSARVVAKNNQASYYSLQQFLSVKKPDETYTTTIDAERRNAMAEGVGKGMSFESQYAEIMSYCSHEKGQFTGKDREEFNEIMSQYLKKRDETCEQVVHADIESIRLSGMYETTSQFPSKEDYEYLVKEKKREISDILEKALAAEYLNVDYSEEQEKAQKLNKKYQEVRACLRKNVFGDIVFLILTVASMLVPYGVLQIHEFSVGTYILYLISAGIFGGLFLLSLFLRTIPYIRKLKKLKVALQKVHWDCAAKHRYAFSGIKRRYKEDLIRVEEARYELRQLKYFYDENVEIDKAVRGHRQLLEDVDDIISGILNNLGVAPVEKEPENVDGEFNMNKSFRSPENQVYRVFSLEAIESMFPQKKREEYDR